MSLEVGGPEIK